MKSLIICVAVLLLATLFYPTTVFARHISRQHSHHRHHHHSTATTREGGVAPKQANYYGEVRRAPGRQYRPRETVQVAGSSLPNCSRACGSCSPCRLVMVTFVCASLQEAETCPMAYRCMCRNKSFPVP